MTNVLSSLPRKTAHPLAVGMTPLMVTGTTSFCMAAIQWSHPQRRASGEATKWAAWTFREAAGVPNARALFETEQADAPRTGLLDHLWLFEQQDFSRFKRSGPKLGLTHGLQGTEPEAGNIK